MIGLDRVEVRVAEGVSDTCLICCDDEMLVLLPLATAASPTAAAIHLRRQTDDGLLDRYLEHLQLERTNPTTTAPLTDPAQFAAHLARSNHQPASAKPDGAPAQTDGAIGRDGPRGWPRRTA